MLSVWPPTFLAPRTHNETASFALRSTCDFAVRSSVNAVSCNSLHVKARPVNCNYMLILLIPAKTDRLFEKLKIFNVN